MLEKELNELSDETILTLYKSIVPSTSIIESVNKKLERQSAEGTLRNKKELSKRNDNDFRADKTFLNFQRAFEPNPPGTHPHTQCFTYPGCSINHRETWVVE